MESHLKCFQLQNRQKLRYHCISFRFNFLIYVIYSFLQCSYQTAALQAFRKCRTIINHRDPKGTKRENNAKQQQQQQQKKKTRRCGSLLSGMLFTLYESFEGQIFASLGLFTFARIACLLQLWIKTSNLITLFGRRPNKKTYENINWL